MSETEVEHNEHVVRIDGATEQEVDKAYETLREIGLANAIDTNSPLNTGMHPQSNTALDLITSNLDGIRAVLEEHGHEGISASHPPVKEDVWQVD